MCGEHVSALAVVAGSVGSPPRVRGACANQHRALFACRITPACAGSIHTAIKRARRNRDHPRVCGEHLSFLRNIKMS